MLPVRAAFPILALIVALLAPDVAAARTTPPAGPATPPQGHRFGAIAAVAGLGVAILVASVMATTLPGSPPRSAGQRPPAAPPAQPRCARPGAGSPG